MPIEHWSDHVALVHMSDDPLFTEDLLALEKPLTQKKMHAVLDFASVHYVNSSNIARLLRIRKMATEQGTRIVLSGMHTHVWSTFLMTGLDKIFENADSVATALASLQMK